MTTKPAGMNEDTGFKTRFFVVWLDEHGNAVRVNTGRIAAVSSEEAVSYGQCVARGGTSRGYQGHYRYRVLTQDSGSMVIFLDCSTERSSDRFFCCSPAPLAQLPLPSPVLRLCFRGGPSAP